MVGLWTPRVRPGEVIFVLAVCDVNFIQGHDVFGKDHLVGKHAVLVSRSVVLLGSACLIPLSFEKIWTRALIRPECFSLVLEGLVAGAQVTNSLVDVRVDESTKGALR